jgi:hypothetical protein
VPSRTDELGKGGSMNGHSLQLSPTVKYEWEPMRPWGAFKLDNVEFWSPTTAGWMVNVLYSAFCMTWVSVAYAMLVGRE